MPSPLQVFGREQRSLEWTLHGGYLRWPSSCKWGVGVVKGVICKMHMQTPAC